MNFLFLFPADYFNPQQVDENYKQEFLSFKNAGFNVALLKSLRDNSFKLTMPPGVNVVYRGWMLSALDYENLVKIIADFGANAFISPQEYLATHYLPN